MINEDFCDCKSLFYVFNYKIHKIKKTLEKLRWN